MKTLNLKFAATIAAVSLFSLSAVSAFAETATNTISTNTPALKHPKPKAEKKEKAEEGEKVAKPYPFHGTVASVDKKGVSFTLEGKEKARVIKVGSQSLFVKDGKPATFSQIAVGDYAKGRVEKDAEQHEVLVKGTFGPAPEKKADKPADSKPTEAKPAKKEKVAKPAPAAEAK